MVTTSCSGLNTKHELNARTEDLQQIYNPSQSLELSERQTWMKERKLLHSWINRRLYREATLTDQENIANRTSEKTWS